MVKVDLMNGLGNLLFQYAYGRALSLKYQEELLLNPATINLVSVGLFGKSNTTVGLRHCILNKDVAWQSNITGYTSGVIDLLHYIYFRKKKMTHGQENYYKLTSQGLFFTDDNHTFYQHIKSDKNKIVLGGFNAPEFFEEYRNVIRKECKIKTPPSVINENMIKEIKQCNAVCVHIRRGDYVKNNFSTRSIYKKIAGFNICTPKYYIRGMEYISDRVANPIFYIFSNNSQDIAWIKDRFDFSDKNVKYVDLNNPDYEELRLMYSCKHFVISNSTFSWWGSYLSDNIAKIIVAPSFWYKGYEPPLDIYTDDMILIDP